MGAAGIDYEELVRDALRDVVRLALEPVAEEGLPGEHHFFITFRTGDPGVSISPQLAAAHPHEITVVLQHEFRDLVVGERSFSVTLRFGGKPERLTVPYTALTSFVDPAAEFGLRWQAAEDAADGEPPEAGGDPEPETDAGDGGSTVLKFDDPRRR